VCLRAEHGHARARGSKDPTRPPPPTPPIKGPPHRSSVPATLCDPAAKALLPTAQLPAIDQRLGDHEAHVVARARMLAPGVAQSNDQPVDGPATAKGASQERSPSPEASSPPASSAASPGSSPSPTSSVSASISSSTSACSLGGERVATTVSSTSSSSVTPAGIATAASPIVSPICISPTSCTIASGIAVGRASTFTSRVICSSTPPSFTPGASSTPV